jgi:hydrogenase maturation protease
LKKEGEEQRRRGQVHVFGQRLLAKIVRSLKNGPVPDCTELPMKTIVIGLGNPLVTDDSVGLRVAAALKDVLAARPDVEVTEDYWGGLRLMERLIGYERAIIIDAICTGAPPGTIHRLTPDAMPTQRSASAHDVNLPTALEFGRQAGVSLPENRHILLVAIEVEDILTFGEACTPAVQAAVAPAVEEVIEALGPLPGGKP